jgi:Sporulation and spore germination
MTALLAPACDDPAPTPKPPEGYAPIYFLEGRGLLPEYRRVPSQSPVRALYDHLVEGPTQSQSITTLTPQIDLVSIGEIDEGLLLEMSDTFWQMNPEKRAKAAAQIVHTMASLEDGKEVTFLRGALPEPIEVGDGRRVDRPVTRDDYERFAPWIEVVQPVAGATVGGQIPVRVRLREELPFKVQLRSRQTGFQESFPASGGILQVREEMSGPSRLLVIAKQWGLWRFVVVPVTVAPNQGSS